MSLDHPENEKEAYLNSIRIYMERLFGMSLKSMKMNGVNFFPKGSKKASKVELFRFQTHFQIPLPIPTSYLDVFIHPDTKNPHIILHGEESFETEIEEPVPFEKLEPLFASLIWGAKRTKKGGISILFNRPVIQ